MFKSIGNFLYRTPWWAMAALGFAVLMLLVLFATPTHLMRLEESGATPEEKRAIKSEINRAVGDSALNFAENIVRSLKNHSSEPGRKQELDQALQDIARARKEMYDAKKGAAKQAADTARQSMIAANEAAMETAREAAEAAVQSARDSRESLEETRRETAEKLKASGVDAKATLKELDSLIKTAKQKEKAAADTVQKIRDTRKRGLSIGIGADEDGLKVDVQPDVKGKPGISFTFDDDDGVKKTVSIPNPDVVVPAPGVAAKPGLSDKLAKVPEKVGKMADKFADKLAAKTGAAKDGTKETTKETTPGTGDYSIGPDRDGRPSIRLPGLPQTLPMAEPAPPVAPMSPINPLAPEFRDNIRNVVASDVRRVGIGSVAVLAFIPLFVMLLVAKVLVGRQRRAVEFAEQKKKEAEVSNVNRQITEARLQALQAQVEPHFLYNTLANVQALTEVDPVQANQMTGHLIQYLRSSLPKMRENTSTVGQEIELVRAYLNILRMRMGDRLDFAIECEADLLNISFPPMMLPSLVENAIKHGLEPQREGGRIDVVVNRVVTASGSRIRVAVKDTGRGLTDTPTQAGGGVGLSNIRERLIAIYGDAGKLTLESNEPKGVVASIEMPAEMGKSGGPSSDSPAGYASSASGAASSSSSFRPSGAASAASTGPATPKGWWAQTRSAISATHGVWAKIISLTFTTMMLTAAVLFGLALAAMLAGVLPVDMGNTRMHGLEGMAMGTLGLIAGFMVVALAIVLVVAVLYGLGIMAAGLLIFIPVVILVASFPALAPFLLIGMAVYWFVKRKRKSAADALAK